MLVGVAVRAVEELNRVNRCPALWNMALRALQRCVLALERIGGRRMLLQPERGRPKTVDGVARGALASTFAFRELSSMRIQPMAVGTLLKDQVLPEVAFGVTLHTIYFAMFALQ